MNYYSKFLIISKKIRLCFLCIFICCVASCSLNDIDSRKNELYVHKEVHCNFLIYMAADNNLERFAIQNLKTLQEIGTTENVNIIVLLDRSGGYDRTEGNWANTKLFLVNKSKNMNDDVIYEYAELDMTSGDTLYNFLEFTNTYFPAKHTVLDIWSHGRGVYPDGVISKSVIEDHTTGYGSNNMMTICELSKCIKKYEDNSNSKIDIILFDACYMQMIEICYQLRNVTNYIIGAETAIPGTGHNYREIANFLKNESFTMKDFVKFLVKSTSVSKIDYSYSSIDTSFLNEFLSVFNDYCIELINNNEFNKLIENRKNLEKIASVYPEFVDLYELIYSLEESTKKDKLLEVLSLLIIENNSTGDYENKVKGLSINFPYEESEINFYKRDVNRYEKLDFYVDSYFDELLIKIWE